MGGRCGWWISGGGWGSNSRQWIQGDSFGLRAVPPLCTRRNRTHTRVSTRNLHSRHWCRVRASKDVKKGPPKPASLSLATSAPTAPPRPATTRPFSPPPFSSEQRAQAGGGEEELVEEEVRQPELERSRSRRSAFHRVVYSPSPAPQR